MARTEQEFWNWIRPKLPGHIQRVENAIDRGTPDVNICHVGEHIWIELKVLDKGVVKLRKEQKAWALRRKVAGGRVVCVADMHNGTVAAWELPCNTTTMNETYQQIVALPDFVVLYNEIDYLISWVFRKEN